MKKILAMLMVIIIMSTVMMGCSKKETENEGVDQTPSETNDQDGDALDKPLEKEEVTLTFFHHMSEEAKRLGIEKLAAAFSERNPEVTFDIQAMDFGQYASTLKTKIAADDAPDIMFGRPKGYSDLVQAGHIMELSGNDYINHMQDSALPALTVDGGVYGIVLDVTAMGTFYNKDIFAAHGLEVPTTFDELMHIAKTLDAAGITAFSRGYKDAWTAQVEHNAFNHGEMFGLYPNWMQEITEGTKKFSDYPEFTSTLQAWADTLPYSNDDIFGTDYSKSIELFATGQAAMFSQGMWALGEIRKIAPDINIGFMAPPATNQADLVKLSAFGDDGFMMSASTKHPEYVNAFFDFVLSSEGATIWSDTAGQVSFMKDSGVTYTDPAILEFISYIEEGKTVGQEDGPFLAGQMDATYREYQELFAAKGDKEVESFVSDLDAEFDAIRD
ncbi:extracellular solute-binding protein [Vallitalea pronyensis]|uniref:Extracellular solute-binding protein n=1 Tax=Vallitalea pronyensis TaxID=1348613 RepID=A0A8J8MIW7_9FIRM|nr:extracellular solute-binding protein [Vallitalea pronyensis]QUI22475.1 extracellular solute-binding protein [Vallitalea pronyensis]